MDQLLLKFSFISLVLVTLLIEMHIHIACYSIDVPSPRGVRGNWKTQNPKNPIRLGMAKMTRPASTRPGPPRLGRPGPDPC